MKIECFTAETAFKAIQKGFEFKAEEAGAGVQLVVDGEVVAEYTTPSYSAGMMVYVPPMEIHLA